MYNSLFNLYRFCNGNITEIEGFYNAISDRSEMYACHHRLETHNEFGNLRDTLISKVDLINQGLYYNRPASELILIKTSEHSSLHRQFSNIDGHRYLAEESREDEIRKSHAEYNRNYRLDEDKYNKQLESNKKYQDKHKKEIREYQKEYHKTEKYKESYRKSANKYNNQLCLYNDEKLTLNALRARFTKQGISHPTQEAKKYLIIE